jgi:hypothetical protein
MDSGTDAGVENARASGVGGFEAGLFPKLWFNFANPRLIKLNPRGRSAVAGVAAFDIGEFANNAFLANRRCSRSDFPWCED